MHTGQCFFADHDKQSEVRGLRAAMKDIQKKDTDALHFDATATKESEIHIAPPTVQLHQGFCIGQPSITGSKDVDVLNHHRPRETPPLPSVLRSPYARIGVEHCVPAALES